MEMIPFCLEIRSKHILGEEQENCRDLQKYQIIELAMEPYVRKHHCLKNLKKNV